MSPTRPSPCRTRFCNPRSPLRTWAPFRNSDQRERALHPTQVPALDAAYKKFTIPRPPRGSQLAALRLSPLTRANPCRGLTARRVACPCPVATRSEWRGRRRGSWREGAEDRRCGDGSEQRATRGGSAAAAAAGDRGELSAKVGRFHRCLG